MADLTTLLSKFLVNLWSGAIWNAVLGGTTIGIPGIVAQGNLTGQVAQATSVAAFTVGASDGTFEVSMNCFPTTATTHSFSLEVAYTDEGNNPRVNTFPLSVLAGTIAQLITNGGGSVPYPSLPLLIRAKAGTTITLRTNAAGTYTAVVYNVRGIIKQVN